MHGPRPATRVGGHAVRDLGVDGDGGLELIAAFARRFDVDVSGFVPARHFGPEGVPPWVIVTWLLRILLRWDATPEERAGLEPITMGDLVRAAEAKRWP